MRNKNEKQDEKHSPKYENQDEKHSHLEKNENIAKSMRKANLSIRGQVLRGTPGSRGIALIWFSRLFQAQNRDRRIINPYSKFRHYRSASIYVLTRDSASWK
jgi:hypothetical protein